MQPKVNLTGIIHKIVKVTADDKKVQMFDITMATKNEFPDKDGEYKGKYGRSFFNVKYFANSEASEKFVNEILRKIEEEKTIISIDAELRNNNFENANGKKQYRDDIVAVNIHPYP